MSHIPDYQKHLTYVASAYDVAKLADRVKRQNVSTCPSLVQHVINSAGGVGNSISGLSLNQLQRVYFELRLLEAGAKITYERVRLQGVEVQTVLSDIVLNPSLEELEELVECVNVFETSGAIKKMIDDVREKTGVHGARLGDLGGIGFDLVYSELIRVLVNVGEKL